LQAALDALHDRTHMTRRHPQTVARLHDDIDSPRKPGKAATA